MPLDWDDVVDAILTTMHAYVYLAGVGGLAMDSRWTGGELPSGCIVVVAYSML